MNILSVEQAVTVIKGGGVVVAPTETAYALVADAHNEQAVAKIFAIKGRDEAKPLPLVAASVEDVAEVATIPDRLKTLAHEHWPGALTLVVPTHTVFPRGVVREGMIAVRVSRSAVMHHIAGAIGLVTATSANTSGSATCYSVDDVYAQLGDTVDGYINGGVLEGLLPSTIVALEHGEVRVLRQGSITL